jgi:hypothetical protein
MFYCIRVRVYTRPMLWGDNMLLRAVHPSHSRRSTGQPNTQPQGGSSGHMDHRGAEPYATALPSEQGSASLTQSQSLTAEWQSHAGPPAPLGPPEWQTGQPRQDLRADDMAIPAPGASGGYSQRSMMYSTGQPTLGGDARLCFVLVAVGSYLCIFKMYDPTDSCYEMNEMNLPFPVLGPVGSLGKPYPRYRQFGLGTPKL